MRRLLAALAVVGVLALSACDSGEPSAPGDGTGVGMTYGGKTGIDVGGVVIPFDGSPAQPGFGY